MNLQVTTEYWIRLAAAARDEGVGVEEFVLGALERALRPVESRREGAARDILELEALWRSGPGPSDGGAGVELAYAAVYDHDILTMVFSELRMRTMAAGEFKAKCLAVMDEVQAKREAVVLTKYGKPVAKLVPMELENGEDPIFGFMIGKGRIVGDPMDLVEPIVPEEDWDTDWARFA